MIAPARIAAWETLVAVERRRADLPAALARARQALVDDRDRALAGEIATGTLRWQGAIDRVIESFARRPLARLDAEVVAVLRLSIFQLLHLDRVPASAVVNDAVQMTRRAGKSSAAGFVNALLRRVSRERQHLPLPPEPQSAGTADALAYLTVTLSHPGWLAARWLERYGLADAAAWERFDNAPAPLTLRANRLKIDRDALAQRLLEHGVDVVLGAHAPDALVVRQGNPLLTPLAQEGLFVVQDEASQLVGGFVEAQPGEVVLDACASPGGKTTLMAADMADRGRIVAADVRGRRVDLLVHAIRASGATSVGVVQADAEGQLPFPPASFDAVLLDAPCSGLGTIRRDPDIKWRRQADDLPVLAAAQRRMLATAAAVVRPGGRVVYSTCSSEPDENDAVVQAFLEDAPEFELRGILRTLPFRDGLEAFYAARLVRAGVR